MTQGDPNLEPDWILADLHLCDGRYVRICGPVGWKPWMDVIVFVWKASREGRPGRFVAPSLVFAEELFRHPGRKCMKKGDKCHYSRTEAAPRELVA